MALIRSVCRAPALDDDRGRRIVRGWHVVPIAGWGVGVGIPVAPLDLAIYQAVSTAAAGALLCVMLGLYFASIVARHLVQPLDQLSKGTTDVTAPVVVREVADLHQALTAAQDRDVATRKRLQATADEFETLFNSSPIALAFAHDRECHQSSPTTPRWRRCSVGRRQPHGPHAIQAAPQRRGCWRPTNSRCRGRPRAARKCHRLKLQVVVEGPAPARAGAGRSTARRDRLAARCHRRRGRHHRARAQRRATAQRRPTPA